MESKYFKVSSFISVDYDEFKPETYRGVNVEFKDKKKVFNTGDFLADLKSGLDYVRSLHVPISILSSIDNYVMDSKVDRYHYREVIGF
jgi:hypothetical protein